MATVPSRSAALASRSTLQVAALAFGAVFIIIGLAGFVPGITSGLGTLEMAGHESHAKLFGVFQVSILHNIVHLLFGVAGIVVSRSFATSRLYFFAGGVIYLLLTVFGLLVGRNSSANFLPLNRADDGLHLVLGVAMLAVALFLGRKPATRPAGRR